MFNLIKKYMENLKVEEVPTVVETVESPVVEVVEVVVGQEYVNEFRVYSDSENFKSFKTVEEAQSESTINGGVITVASVK